LALAISLVLNGLILARIKIDWMSKLSAAGPARAVALAPLSASQWAANRALAGASGGRPPPSRAAAAPALAPPTPARHAPGQVVEVAPSKDDAAPKDTRFVSDRNNTVEKETRSRAARPGYAQTLAKPSEPRTPTPAQPPAVTSRGGGGGAGKGRAQPKGAKGGEKGAAEPRTERQPSQEKLALRLDPRGGLRAAEPGPKLQGSAGSFQGGAPARGDSEGQKSDVGRGAGKPGPLALRPGAADYERLTGGPAPDRLDGVEDGEGTYLNTREWKFAGYFNRIKQAVASQWDPGSAMVARDPGGSKLGYKDWQTLLSVKLDGGGVLRDVSVVKSSGLDFLDRTAVDAFQRAQPFSNPPQGLADSRGEIVFTFGFYLETGGSGLHLFRGPALPR
jgi:TonB family protein